MTTKDISQKVADRIRGAGIKPAPRSRFAAFNAFFWALAASSLVVGALALAVSVDLVAANGWNDPAGVGPFFALRSMPLLWFAALMLFVYLGERYYRRTALGYRHRLALVLGVYIGATALLGWSMYAMGWGRSVDSSLASSVPEYRHLVWDKEEIWSHPADGLLAGRIENVGVRELVIVDLRGGKWSIDLSRAVIRNRVILAPGETIKVIGRQAELGTFIAAEVRPWEGNSRNRNGDRPRQ